MQTKQATSQSLTQRTTDLVENTRVRFAQRNLEWVSVGWDDCARSKFSSLGPNISDWSFRARYPGDTGEGRLLQFIRHPNYTDRTSTVSSSDVCLVLPDEGPDHHLRMVTLTDYLSNYGRYTPGVPDSVDLSNGPNELVTIRYIAVIAPEDETGTCEVVPTAYNYQTVDPKNPKNVIAASFHMGVGSRVDGTGAQPVYLVKPDADGGPQDTWFRITNSERETAEQQEATESVLGTRSTGAGRNRVQCLQIPLKQKKASRLVPKGIPAGIPAGAPDCALESCQMRSLATGNVSYGSSAGRHTPQEGIHYKRDREQHITLTFAYYYTTSSSHLSDAEVAEVADTLEASYKDVAAKWTGSLVTGEADAAAADAAADAPPPIHLSPLTKEDVSVIHQKVTQFPKKPEDLMAFPT